MVMQNPSYAGEDVADKSVQFMEKVVFKKELEAFKGVMHPCGENMMVLF